MQTCIRTNRANSLLLTIKSQSMPALQNRYGAHGCAQFSLPRVLSMRAYNLFMPLRNGPWRGVLSRCHQAPPSLPHSVHSYLNTDHQHLISTLISSCIKAHTSPKLIVWSTSWCTDHLPADLCDSLLQLLTVFSLCLQCPPSCIYSSKSILQELCALQQIHNPSPSAKTVNLFIRQYCIASLILNISTHPFSQLIKSEVAEKLYLKWHLL